jgi:uncharacterized protein YmfQ (DUF2313 family)
MRVAKDYLKLLQSLLPSGPAWTRSLGAVLTQFLDGISKEYARLEARAYDLLRERDTRTTTNLLVDHEHDLGLPDIDVDIEKTLEERRHDAHAKTIARGRLDKQYYVELAAAYGWEVEIVENKPFWTNVGSVGDSINTAEAIFYWTVIFKFAPGQTGDITYALHRIEKYKPAHTIINYRIEGAPFPTGGFDQGFSSGFDKP